VKTESLLIVTFMDSYLLQNGKIILLRIQISQDKENNWRISILIVASV